MNNLLDTINGPIIMLAALTSTNTYQLLTSTSKIEV